MPEKLQPSENFRLDPSVRRDLQRDLVDNLDLHGTRGANWVAEHGGEIAAIIDNPDFAEQLEENRDQVLADLTERFRDTVPPVDVDDAA